MLEQRAQKLEKAVARLERQLEKARWQSWKDETPVLIELDYPSAPIVLDGATKLARKRKNATTKEPQTVAWIESLAAGDVLYDIGANVGAYSLIAALRPQGALRVLAFEPAFANYALLCRNVVHNRAGEHIMPLPITLGAATAVGTFGYSTLSAGAGTHAGLGASGSEAYDQPVLVFALDDLIERFELPFPQHVKLDVERAEVDVLRGGARTLTDPRLQSTLVEIGAESEDEVETLMTGCGLTRVDTLRSGQTAEEPFLYALYRR
jgi:FkbM family methyltransferase